MAKRIALPSRVQKRLISTLMCNAKEPNQDPNFTLKSNAEFASRSKNIFEGLKDIELNHETWVSENEVVKKEESDCNPVTKTEVFKKPTAVKFRKRKINIASDPRKKKWTKYSLADVPLSSDATNSAVALQFLDDLRKSREKNHHSNDASGKILYSKPTVKEEKVADVEGIRHRAKEIIKAIPLTDENKFLSKKPDVHLEHLMNDDAEQLLDDCS